MDKRTQNLRATKAGRRAPPPSTLVLWGEQLTPLPFGSQKQIQLTKLAIWGGWEEQRRGTCFISYWFSELNQLIKQLQPGQGEQNFLFAVWISWALPRQTINNVSASLKHTASTNKLFLKRKNNKKNQSWIHLSRQNVFIMLNDEQCKWYIDYPPLPPLVTNSRTRFIILWN